MGSKGPPTKLAPDFQQKSTNLKHLLPSSNFVPGANDRVGATVATGAVGTGRPRDTGAGAGGGCDMVLPRAFGEGMKKCLTKWAYILIVTVINGATISVTGLLNR